MNLKISAISIVMLISIAVAALPQLVWAQLIIDRITVKEKAAEPNSLGGMQISFYTNEPTTARIDYGLTANYGQFIGSSTPATYHEITLVSLKSQTTYHYRLTVTSLSGEQVSTMDYTFKTGKVVAPRTTSLSTADVRVTAVGGSYFIVTWLADDDLNGEVHYNTVENFIKPSKVRASKYGNRFEAVVTRLKPNTKYYWRVYVYDKDGNNGSSSVQTITTSTIDNAQEPLVIADISPLTSTDPHLTDTTAVIKWRTNLPARADVTVRPAKRGVKGGGTIKATIYNTNHEAIFTGLTPGSDYVFTIQARDIYGKRLSTGQFGFTTKKFQPAPQVAGVTATCFRAVWTYQQCRNLNAERAKAIELKEYLNKVYNNRVPSAALKNWYTLVNAYTYGGYPKEAIVKAIKYSGKTVHPTIPFSAWRQSRDYKDYINR